VRSCLRNAKLFHTDRTGEALKDLANQKHLFLNRDSTQHLIVFRHATLGLSYAEMVHPTDFVMAEADGGQCYARSTLFPERLEKGVIRRGRVCGWFLPTENDLATAVELASQFVDEPLPLTT
jgi:hypothetical protein